MIVGIDPSLTATGIAMVWRHGAVELRTITSKPEAPETRLPSIVAQVERILDHGVDLAVIEGLSFGSNDQSAQERAALHFMLRIKMHNMAIPYRVVAPSSVKKFTAGSGSAKKEHMLKAVFQRYGIDTDDNNQADAVAMAYLGAALLGWRTAENQPQREVLEKMLAGPVAKKPRKMRVRGDIA